ncbi:uncharacterized protein F5147DRAFT_656670 [Suillus discolor]|uniref:DUF6532 domain-containing protein n=1 Tax=Suillus discolor TaxID=1912936 RepID=A0A9P7EXP6_9AGAM|nr:uncharacterized protein F5147DRAFT_656670 [Suillus discolor]KAG2096055.1 hypothetical protein F5147DRAFT_656670 [Suillus discolor]
MGKLKRLRVVLSDSSALNLSDYDLEIATPLVEPEVDSPSGPRRCTRRPNAGKGGAASQLRRAGEAVIDEPGRCTGKGQQFVIPDGEPENIMAPSPAKKRTRKKGKKSAVPAVTTPDQSDDAGFAPSLHVAEPGERFRLQKNPIPPGYVSLQHFGLEEHPEHLKSCIQRDRPRSHTHTEVARRPAVEPPVIRAPTIHGAQPTIPRPKPPVRKKSSGAGRAFPDSASSILWPVAVSENEETEHHGDKDMSKVDDGLNMVDDDKFPLSNDEMCTSPPVELSIDRSADENEDIGHTQRHQGQAEQRVDRLGHASRKDDRQDRRKDHARSNTIAEVPNVDYDVVKRHQKTNRRIWSPSPMYLHSVRHSGFTVKQPNTKRACTSNLRSNNDRQAAVDSDGDMKVDSDSEVCGCTKAAKNAQGSAVVPKRKTLGFFPDLWVKLLNYTKACFRLHLAIADPFPARKEALGDTGFYPQYKYDMATVIYNDSINFRSRIKQITINVVPVEYKLSGSESEIKQKASTLLKGSTYLHGDRDEHDRTSNFVHSGLRSVCLQAFYDGGSKSLQQFPEFHNTIPRKALLLVATIQTALGDSGKVYHKLTNMLKQVADDEYHSEKLDEALRSWALTGITIDHRHQENPNLLNLA